LKSCQGDFIGIEKHLLKLITTADKWVSLLEEYNTKIPKYQDSVG